MSDQHDAALSDEVRAFKELVVAYAKQETIDPIKALGRWVAFGIIGSVFVGIGLLLGILAGLRALQHETGTTFDGRWSWAPYGITAVGCLLIVGMAAAAASRKGGSR